MLYKEVQPSSVLPGSTSEQGISINDIEKMFETFFYQKGPKSYQTYRSSSFQSTSTFLKDLITNLIKFSDNEKINEQQKVELTALLNAITNILTAVESIFEKNDQDQFNAVICGTLIRHLKKIFP